MVGVYWLDSAARGGLECGFGFLCEWVFRLDFLDFWLVGVLLEVVNDDGLGIMGCGMLDLNFDGVFWIIRAWKFFLGPLLR